MSSDLQPPSTRAAERLAVIVDAAERAALKVIDDAEKEANRYLGEARARADRIVADRLREEADRLDNGDIAEIEPRLRPVEQRGGTDEDPLDDYPDLEDGRDREPPSIAAVASPKPVGESGAGSAAARLLATQMAVSGSTRVEIEARLRSGFEIEDTSEILDAILGPEE